MGNTAKRKNRRMKKTVRKTVGALLMVTAITVAAIPVPENMAYDPTTEGVPAYTDLSIDDLGTDVLPNSTTHPTSNGTAYTISSPLIILLSARNINIDIRKINNTTGRNIFRKNTPMF